MQNVPGKTITYIDHSARLRPIAQARPYHLRRERSLIELHAGIGADCRRKKSCNRSNEIRPSGDGIGCLQRYPAIYETELLPNCKAQTFFSGTGLYQARRKRKGNLIRIIDPVAAAEPVFSQHLRKAEVGFCRVEVGQAILVPERHINIKETRLKGLRELLSKQGDAAIERNAAIHTE